MNKKYLSVILFGALMLGTTGTFTSCKDYDDDINNLQEQITANADAIKKLQDLVGDGKFVTGVTSDGNTITFTFSDNSTVPVTIETEQAQKVEVKGDELYIDDQPTGIKVAKEAEIEAGLVKAENGTWWVLGEDGKYTDTEIPVSGVTAVKNDKDQWVLTIYSQDGSEPKTIVLPTAASLITEIEVLGVVNSNDENTANKVTNGIVNYNATVLGDLNDNQKAWNKEEGVKTLAKGQALSTLSSDYSKLLIRLAPATVDASEMSFTLVNTQLGEAPLTLGTPAAYKGLLTRSAESNGLWVVPVSAKEGLTYKDLNAYKAEFEVNGNGILFAFQEKEGFTSDWNLSFKFSEEVELETAVKKVNSTDVTGKTSSTKYSNTDVQTDANVAANVDAGNVTITFTDANALYDAHLHFDEATIERWGIKYTEGTSFTITAQPDEVTAANFQVQVHYVDMTGAVKSEWIILHVNKSYSDVTEYPNKNVEIAADNTKNTFDATLDAMFTNLGSNLNKWKADVETATYTYEAYDKDNKVWKTTYLNSDNMKAVLDKGANQATKFTWNLSSNTVAMDLDTQYRVVIEFKDKDGEVLSKLIQPITFSIPALSNVLVKEQVVFGGTSNGKAYMNTEDNLASETNGTRTSRYAFTHAFKNFDKAFDNTAITFAIDPTQKIGNTLVDNNYATLSNQTSKDVAIELIKDKDKGVIAYHTPIQIIVSSAKYLGIYDYSKEELAANAFTLDVMSPIEQGNVVAANAAGVSVVATADGTALVKESDFKATTYANVAYKVFKDKFNGTETTASEYSSEYISTVAFSSANVNVFKVVDKDGKETTKGFAATRDDKGVISEGYIIVKPANAGYEATENVNITVTDIWGYSKKAAVSVTVKPSTAE